MDLLYFKPLWGPVLQTGPFWYKYCFKHSITHASISHLHIYCSILFYCLFGVIISDVILLSCFVTRLFTLCQFMLCHWVKPAAPAHYIFIIIYPLTTSSHGKLAVQSTSHLNTCICLCHHHWDQMTIDNCCLLIFQTALCQKRGAACFFFLNWQTFKWHQRRYFQSLSI